MNNVIEGYRISPQQKRLWMLDRDAGFAARCMVRIDGPVDPRRLAEKLRATASHHEILRTTFRQPPELDVPVQVIGTGEPAWEETLQLQAAPEADRQGLLEAAYESLGRPFDIQAGPTVRARLVTLADDAHVLLLAVPALCADAAGLRNLAAGACELDTSMQYADIAEWMNAGLVSEDSEPGRRYWRELGWTDGTAAKLPFRKTACAAAPFVPQSLEFHVRRPDTDAGVLLAAWALVLKRSGMESDHGISVVFDGRMHEELKGLPGLFARCLPVKITVDPGASFQDLAQHARDQMAEAAKWQDCFEWPAEMNAAFLPFCFEYSEAAGIRTDARIDRFHLKLSFERTGADVRARLEWDSAVYALEDVERLARSVQAVLDRAGDGPQTLMSEFDTLDEADRAQVITGFNSTGVPFPAGCTLPQLFEEQAARTPARIAVSYGSSAVTYAELNGRVNQLARHLRLFGVKPETAVGVCLERSIEMVVAILGVLKAGAAYIPIDPDYPADRILHMLQDSGTTVVLTQERLAAQLPPCHARVIPIDAEWDEIARESRENPPRRAEAGNPAYIIYTSGSTGKPKGAAVTHSAICNHMFWMQDEFPLTVEDRVLQKTPFSFDASVWEFYAPLFAGAALVMARPLGHQDPVYMVETLRRERITILQLVPSLLRALLETPGFEDCDSLRSVFCGGEPLTVELRQRFYQRSKAGLHNLYGPTEATIDATYWRCAPDEDIVPIGRPIANTEIYILDRGMQPAPVGVPGEIFIGGECLARGYWQRPGLTAEKFIPDPFSPRRSARLYRTGDLGRWLPDGRLECLGRLDHQVKLRGFRIELGEIEARLSEHPSVRQSVVVAREDTPGDHRLAAYVVAQAGAAVNPEELRAHLSQRLPEYMVPAAFVELAELPLTPNGKVDRRALPAPQQRAAQAGYIAPRTADEELLAGIWAALLRLERVGIDDNFFVLGGHSLLATQVVGRVRAVLGVELPLRAMFEAPTLAQLAARVAALRGIDTSDQPRLEPASGPAREQLSWAQQRLWFLEQFENAPGLYHITIPVRLRGQLQVEGVQAALCEVVRRHEALRTGFVLRQGQPVAVVMDPWEVELPVSDLRGDNSDDQQRQWSQWAAEQAREPFDLAGGRLLRVRLVRLADEEQILLLCVHHMVADGWSLGVLVRELGVLYEAWMEGRTAELPAPVVQYGDYAAWQREWLSGEVRERQMNYWKQQLAGSPGVLELPTDHARPALASHAGASCQVRLEPELVERLEALSRRQGVTLFMTLLAAFQTLLSRYSGQADIAVGTPIANRTRAELEGLIGMFVNTLVLRTDLADNPPFEQLLERVREVCLGAYAHQDLPFEQLVEALEPEREMNRHPLFQVMFVMQNNSLELQLRGIEAEAVEVPVEVAKLDLALILNPARGGLEASLQYATELYRSDTIGRMLGHYVNILEAVAASSETRISELPLLRPEERQEILAGRNLTAEDFGEERCAHLVVEARAARTPEALAIVYGQEKITYRELNRQANRLAHYLRKRGAGPESKIGISLERSPRLVVAMLATLKAGAAFVPLAPDYPHERLNFMIADSGASLIVTEQGVGDRLPPGRARVLCMDRLAGAIARESAENPECQSHPAGAAYMIYTSGSTGRPKGVVVEHRGLCNLMPGLGRVLQLDSSSRFLQFASASFDAAIGEIFPTLWAGAALVMAPRDRTTADGPLLELLREQAVTTVILPPSLLAVLADDDLPALQTVVSAGEPCPAPVAARWARSRRFVNGYGPTENTVCATAFECGEGPEQPPIGHPIANVRVYILDQRMEPVPDGACGELYIGGESLARGYFNRPELTAQKFVPDPFSDAPARLYRSGDLGRYRADGTIEFLGRADQQVKIRGFRIEPGEIEAALMEAPGVDCAAVLARRDARGQNRLVAYVATGETPAASADLRQFLSAKLPDYMLPAVFVNLPVLPVTPSGKIDRAALPEPQENGQRQREYAAPRSPLEEILADIWAATLHVDNPGIHDNLFEAGGHSLLVAELAFRIRDLFHIALPLRAIFESPTIAGLAESMCPDEESRSQAESIAAILQSVSDMADSDAQAMLGELKETAAA